MRKYSQFTGTPDYEIIRRARSETYLTGILERRKELC